MATDRPTLSEDLPVVERVVAGLLGAAVLAVGLVIIFDPPSHDEALANCTPSATQCCVEPVSSVPESVTSVIVASGVVLLIVALLGVRFRSLKFAGIELGAKMEAADQNEAEQAKNEGKVEPLAAPAPGKGLAPAPEAGTALWASLPQPIKVSAIDSWRVAGKGGNPWDHLEQVYKPRAGHHEWYLTFADGTTWRASTLQAPR